MTFLLNEKYICMGLNA